MKNLKREEAMDRKKILPQVLEDMEKENLSPWKASQKYSEYKFCDKVLKRNFNAYINGNVRAHQGKLRIFEASDIADSLQSSTFKAMSKNSPDFSAAADFLNNQKERVARQRAEQAESEVSGKALKNMSRASVYRYLPQVVGEPRQTYNQNRARFEALGDLYNATAFVAALRACYGYLYDESNYSVLHSRNALLFLNALLCNRCWPK